MITGCLVLGAGLAVDGVGVRARRLVSGMCVDGRTNAQPPRPYVNACGMRVEGVRVIGNCAGGRSSTQPSRPYVKMGFCFRNIGGDVVRFGGCKTSRWAWAT